MFRSDDVTPTQGKTKSDSLPEIILFGDVLDRVREVSAAVDRRVQRTFEQTGSWPADRASIDS